MGKNKTGTSRRWREIPVVLPTTMSGRPRVPGEEERIWARAW